MIQDEPVSEVAKELGLTMKENNFLLNRQLIIEKVNYLIEKDFQFLVSILYRMDVSENKLASLLNQHPDKIAAETIVDLMLERQLQKIKSRKETKKNNNIPEDDKW